MNNTLTYNAVSKYQIDAVIKKFGLTEEVDGVKGETTLSGKSPLGEVVMQVAFVPLSGQFTVVVIKKPALLTIDTIDGHIRAALSTAAYEQEHAPKTATQTAAEPPVDPGVPTPQKTAQDLLPSSAPLPNPATTPIREAVAPVPEAIAPSVPPASPETKK